MTPPTDSPIRIVVFDLGGVVVRICRSIQEAGRLVGIDVPGTALSPASRAERRAIHARYERGQLACDAFFDEIARTTGGLYAPEQFRAMHLAWITGEYPGVGALIDDLHARGLETGVLSNTNTSHWNQMHTPGRFPTVLKARLRHASHLLGLAKPDAAIYAEFARQTGFAPSEIVFFDDLEPNVAAARASGWNAHAIDHAGDTAAQMRAALHDLHGLAL